jgi:hypothetical protein
VGWPKLSIVGRRTGRLILGGVLLSTLVGAGLLFGRPLLARRADVAHWRAIYGQVPVYPGATKTREVVEEVRADGVPQGEYSLQLVYELPSSTTSSEVLAFLRANLPPGWTTASTETCRQQEYLYPPPMTAPGGAVITTQTTNPPLVIMSQRTELTAFVEGKDGLQGRDLEGVTFSLKRDGHRKLLDVMAPVLRCGGPEADRDDSAKFDAPPSSGTPNPAPELTVPAVEKPTNRNARSTPTSRLCWAQRETLLLVINAMMSSDAKGVVTSTLIPTLDTVDAELTSLQRDNVDPSLGPFVERFAADLTAARSAWTSKPLVSAQDVVYSFDFENYPAVKEFAAAAKRDPGCVDVP